MATATTNDVPLRLEPTKCCLCGVDDAEPIGVGEDFEYRSSEDTFLAVRCLRCGIVFLNPRPTSAEFQRIYPDSYHAFDFDPKEFGFVHRVRQKLEARRLLKFTSGLGSRLQILDVGCGDGFHLDLLKRFGADDWSVQGIDTDRRAVLAARRRGLNVIENDLESAQIDSNHFHLILMIMTVEHLLDPLAMLREVHRILRPGGRLVIVTDNTGSPDFTLTCARHWGGFHFPRHTYLFNQTSLGKLAVAAGLSIESIKTAMSPVNWVYSARNWLDDWGAPRWMVKCFSLKTPVSLAAATIWDMTWTLLGRGAILHGSFRKPATPGHFLEEGAS